MPKPLTGFDATLQHATDWQGERIAGWYWSEKLDGVRARWTGAELLTRSGAPIACPAERLAQLPQGLPLDVEVYAGRGGYERARQAVQLNRWHEDVRFVAFDAPTLPGSWHQRIAAVLALGVEVPAHGIVTSEHAMRHALATCHASGGEGYMLACPGVAYTAGRTPALLKFKHEAIYEEMAA